MIRVLVVDDSLIFREIVSKGISSDPGIEVVAKAVDAFDARDKILEYEPDVIICDVRMTKMNCIDSLNILLPQHSVKVIVMSTLTDMKAGDNFVRKPDVQTSKNIENFINELIVKIKVCVNPRNDMP